MSSGKGCLCPGQQSISHPLGDVDLLWRADSRSGFPLQSLVYVHIYIQHTGPTIREYNNIDRLECTHRTLHQGGTTGCGKAGLPESWCPGGDSHPRPGDGGVMKLEKREAEDDFVYGYGGEGKPFLVHRSHGECEWCSDV